MTPPGASPLDHALALATLGFEVFPVSANKVPRTPNGHKAATREPPRIRAMAAEFGFVLVGVRTGEGSNLAALDIDKGHGGEEWLKSNLDRLPTTFCYGTRSGGCHLWYRHQPGLRCSTSKIAPGVDVRAEGGSIIYWPAAHLPIIMDRPLAYWPTWLAPKPRALPPPENYIGTERPAAHIEASLRGIARTVALAPAGRRNSTLFWGAARCAEMIAAGELRRRPTEALLREAAERAGLDPLEAMKTINSGLRTVTTS